MYGTEDDIYEPEIIGNNKLCYKRNLVVKCAVEHMYIAAVKTDSLLYKKESRQVKYQIKGP
jgi:hypothetical protein